MLLLFVVVVVYMFVFVEVLKFFQIILKVQCEAFVTVRFYERFISHIYLVHRDRQADKEYCVTRNKIEMFYIFSQFLLSGSSYPYTHNTRGQSQFDLFTARYCFLC